MMLSLTPAPSGNGNYVLRDSNSRAAVLIERKDLIPIAQAMLVAAGEPPATDIRYRKRPKP